MTSRNAVSDDILWKNSKIIHNMLWICQEIKILMKHIHSKFDLIIAFEYIIGKPTKYYEAIRLDIDKIENTLEELSETTEDSGGKRANGGLRWKIKFLLYLFGLQLFNVNYYSLSITKKTDLNVDVLFLIEI